VDGAVVDRRPPVAPAALAVAAFGAGAAGALGGSMLLLALCAGLLATSALVTVGTLRWPALVAALVLVIIFIPIRRYAFPGSLPIELEPYRLLVAMLLGGWLAGLLVDPRTRLRATPLGAALALILGVSVASVLANAGRAAEHQTEVLKSLSFLASFVLVFFLVASVVRSRYDADVILKTLVSAMAIVGLLAIVESRTGMSPFAHLDRFIPILQAGDDLVRGSGRRARGPAEHPIALGAALVLAVPLAFHLATAATSRRIWWWACLALLATGTLATLSRTGVLMLVVVLLVYLWLRRRETVRLWPLFLPALAALHFALPGTLGTFKETFFPEGGLVTQQSTSTGDCNSDGRIADIGPTLDEVSRQPLLGIGFGTRIITGPEPNACILDNQWLGTVLEVGVVGFLAWVSLFVGFIRRLGRAGRARTADGDLCVALTAAIAAYAVGMASFDALGFVQVTFVLFLLFGLAAATLARLGSTSLAAGP
jgi:polysaccharide biosynthesis protein PslJ